MRNLTLNEKITIKGKFEKKGIYLPKLNMRSAVHFWYMCFAGPICEYAKISNATAKRNKQ